MKDDYSKTSIHARRAFYVIWTDVYGPRGHEPIFLKRAGYQEVPERAQGQENSEVKDINSKVIRLLDNP